MPTAAESPAIMLTIRVTRLMMVLKVCGRLRLMPGYGHLYLMLRLLAVLTSLSQILRN